MKFLASTIFILTFLITFVACGSSDESEGISPNFGDTPQENRTDVLEGEWTLSITGLSGEYENLIEFSADGKILHWYDESANDFYADLDGGYSNISVSATNQVSFFVQYDYIFDDILYSVEISLTGLLYGSDNLIELNGNNSIFEDGNLTENESLEVSATRGRDGGGNNSNDGALTDILEGAWLFTIDDLIGTEIHSIEFDGAGKIQHWINPYGTDIALIDITSSLFASVSSSYIVDLGASYTFAYEDSVFDVLIELSGEMTSSEDKMVLDGIVKVYSNGYLVSLLHSSVTANRSSFTGSSSSGNDNFSYLEGEWVIANNDEFGVRFGNALCDENGEVTHWYLSDGVEILSEYQSAFALIDLSSDNQAYAHSFYAGTDSYDLPFSMFMEASGKFNIVNKNFMQMVGEVTFVNHSGTYVFPTFLSAFKSSSAATISNGNIWPIKAMFAQRSSMSYGPLFSPWSRG